MVKLFLRAGFAFWLFWQALNFIGNFQTGQSAAQHRGEGFQVILNAATAQPWWISAAIMLVSLGLWLFLERGMRSCPHAAEGNPASRG